jgi:DNA mismatch repair protein MutS
LENQSKNQQSDRYIPEQMDLFPETNPILNELKNIDLNTMSPMEAINRLYEWKKKFLKKD